MRFNSKSLGYVGVFLAIVMVGAGAGVLIANCPSDSVRGRSEAVRYRKARLIAENKNRRRTEMRIDEETSRVRANDLEPTLSANVRAGDDKGAMERDGQALEAVLSEVISYVEAESSVQKSVLLSALKRAKGKGDVKAISRLLRSIALANRGRKSGMAAGNALTWLNSNSAFGGAAGRFGAADLPGENGLGGARAAEGGAVEGGAAEGVENVVADADKDVMTFEEFEAMIKAKEALRNFQSELVNCESEGERIGMVKAKMMTLNDESSCNTLSMTLINSSDKPMAARVIADLATSGSAACQVAAKSAYQWLTGEKWTDATAAQAWAAAYRED